MESCSDLGQKKKKDLWLQIKGTEESTNNKYTMDASSSSNTGVTFAHFLEGGVVTDFRKACNVHFSIYRIIQNKKMSAVRYLSILSVCLWKL